MTPRKAEPSEPVEAQRAKAYLRLALGYIDRGILTEAMDHIAMARTHLSKLNEKPKEVKVMEKLIVKPGTAYKIVPEGREDVNENEGVTLTVDGDGTNAVLTEFNDGEIKASDTLSLAP